VELEEKPDQSPNPSENRDLLVPEKILTAEDILAADDLTTKKIHVPEWGGTVIIRTLSAEGATAFGTYVSDPKNKRKAMLYLVRNSLVNPDGSYVFTEKQAEAFSKKSVKVFGMLQKECLLLNGFADEEDFKKKTEGPQVEIDAA